MPEKYLIVIAGPTAVGKTSTAIEVARHFGAVIVSADSRQLYKELNIGVARPSEEELAAIRHYHIANKSITEIISAGEYERETIALLKELFLDNDVVVMCGGTGFYINAVLYGFDEIPDVDPEIRITLNKAFADHGIALLQQQLKELDETTYNTIDIQNTQRVIRALEVTIGTGRKFSSFKKKNTVQRDFNAIRIGLQLPKEQLHHNINTRVDKMMEAGFLEEAKAVHAYKANNALQTVGYKELFDYLEGKMTLEAAVELIKLHTRQYAKRQLTFFNKHGDYRWFDATQRTELIELLDYVIT